MFSVWATRVIHLCFFHVTDEMLNCKYSNNTKSGILHLCTHCTLSFFIFFVVTETYLDVQLFCCGVHNYTSWIGTPWFNSHNSTVPLSCCKNTTGCTGRLDQLDLLNLQVRDVLAANV